MTIALDHIAITGAGYALEDACGNVLRREKFLCCGVKEASRFLESQGHIKAQTRNFGRFDALTLGAYAASVWACVDAGLTFSDGKRRIGLAGSNREGSLSSNQAFFADYLAAGRNTARGNLFVSTLPTTPLAEVALFCGFTGPLFYGYQPLRGAAYLLEEAALQMAGGDVEAMLAIWMDPGEAVAFVLEKEKEGALWSCAFAQKRLHGATSVRGILQAMDIPS